VGYEASAMGIWQSYWLIRWSLQWKELNSAFFRNRDMNIVVWVLRGTEHSVNLALLPVFHVTGESKGLFEGGTTIHLAERLKWLLQRGTSSEAELRLAQFWNLMTKRLF
jgi:hypothetical protein